jgi:hypothetical protein
MDPWWTTEPPEHWLERLREELPPRSTVYTCQVGQPDRWHAAVVVFGARRSPSGRRPLSFTNLSGHIVGMGACPPAEDSYLDAVIVNGVDERMGDRLRQWPTHGYLSHEAPERALVELLQVEIWLEPQIDLPMTRRQRFQLRRGIGRMFPSRFGFYELAGGLFQHVRLPRV